MNPGESSIESEVTMETAAHVVPEESPFHILVAGEFSGRRRNTLQIKEIDRDNYDSVMKSYSPSVTISDLGPLSISFETLDDFHPDSLFSSLEVFRDLRSLRSRLLNEDTFSSAAGEVRAWLSEGETTEQAPPAEVENSENLLEDILASAEKDWESYGQDSDSIVREFVRKVVDPHLVRVDEADQSRLVALVDDATGNILRTILSDRSFKNLEANWRGLHMMCRQIETASDLKIFTLDISKEQFSEEIRREESELIRILATDTEVPWAFVAGAFDFGLDVEDIACLMRAGGIIGTVSVPFISHVRPGMLGMRSFAENPDHKRWTAEPERSERKLWNALRASGDAESIGLVTPRLLSRLPYGRDTDPTEVIAFEELTPEVNHDEYAWMNPVYGFSVAVAASFRAYGWDMGGRYKLDLHGLPVHVYRTNGETATKPCAEIEMTDAGLELLLEEGLMPFASFKDTDRVRLGGVQSVADERRPLKSRWS